MVVEECDKGFLFRVLKLALGPWHCWEINTWVLL
jgi:hypothetical protein